MLTCFQPRYIKHPNLTNYIDILLKKTFSNQNKEKLKLDQQLETFISLKNSIRSADNSSTKLPVTDLNKSSFWSADSNIHWYKLTHIYTYSPPLKPLPILLGSFLLYLVPVFIRHLQRNS